MSIENKTPNKTPKTQVFAISNVKPEVLAYGKAKYSRSALSLKEALAEISSQKAADFLNTFYFQYGHRSIADLAHVPMCLENVSLLAAIEAVDEQRWDGQERSTRCQDFSKRLYYTPADLDEVEAAHYHKAINALFTAYDETFKAAYARFKEENPKPETLEDAAYERTLRARAFDVARYLLPLATLTSLGQVTSARTLENQVSRLLDSNYAEVRELGEKMKAAAASNVAFTPDAEIPSDERVQLPTLLKHAERSPFAENIRAYAHDRLLRLDIPALCLNGNCLNNTELLAYVTPGDADLNTEIISTILYENSDLPFRAIFNFVRNQAEGWRDKFVQDVLALRGKHDELPRSFRAQSGVIFDIQMDIGGFRDMHRHRRTQQHIQAYQAQDFQWPEPASQKVQDIYLAAIGEVRRAHAVMLNIRETYDRSTEVADYLLPLGAKVRFLMKMDIAEIAYIAELRTGPAGHISYRRVAWQMYQALKHIAPAVAAGIADRVTNPDTPLDFFKR